ncbi:hypothetical protein D3C87_83620 [compost metagenome]
MKNKYLTGLFTVLFFSWNAAAQTVVVPQSVTATVDPYLSNSGPISNLTLDITPSVNSNTTFPYCPGGTFTTGIGFVAYLNADTGTITYTYTNPVSISQMLVWNAYFDFELDHSINSIDLVFKNNSGTIISTVPLTVPEAIASDLKPHVINLPSEIVSVKSVDIRVHSLWGGNDISLRRIAFAGTGQTAGLGENQQNSIELYPNPATDNLTIYEKNIQQVEMFDLNGRNVAIELVKQNESSKISWGTINPGMYQLQITTDKGHFVSKVLVK